MKKKLKKRNIFALILCVIIFGGIGVVQAYKLLANDIGYTPSDSTWKKSNGEDITNVKDAIDELYSKVNSQKVVTQVITITTKNATYTMQNDGYILGTINKNSGGADICFDGNEVAYLDYRDTYHSSMSVSLYAKKGTIVTTRNEGSYNLTIYEWK